MPFDTLTPHLQEVAKRALAHCRNRYGGNGLRVELGIDSSISWRPTFFLKPERFRIIAVEVDDILYPEALKGAAHDISHYDFPISVFQACSLDAYQNDPKHGKVNLLRRHGFGIITVDDAGQVLMQQPCIPLLQFISTERLESEIGSLTPRMKVAFRSAHETYKTSEGQGLQQAGQIVEGTVESLAKQAVQGGVIKKAQANGALADVVDALYETKPFKPHRAALGDARAFIKEFRNTASHAPGSAKQAAAKIRRCQIGFLDAIGVSTKLKEAAAALGYKIQIFVT